MSFKSNKSLTTRTKVVFTLNDFDFDKPLHASDVFTIEDNSWRISIETYRWDQRQKDWFFCVNLNLKSDNRLYARFDAFVFDMDMKRKFSRFGSLMTEYSQTLGGCALITRSHEFLAQKDSLFPRNRLSIGLCITIRFSEVRPIIERGFGSRLKFNVEAVNDFKIICGRKEFFVSKLILSSRSEYFEILFGDHPRNGSINELVVRDIAEHIMEIFLKFIYFGFSDILDQFSEELLVVADRYRVRDLKNICEKLLFTEICAKNAIKLLNIFHKHKSYQMTDKTIEFIAKNFSDIRLNCFLQWKQLIETESDMTDRIAQRMAHIIESKSDDKKSDNNLKIYTFCYI